MTNNINSLIEVAIARASGTYDVVNEQLANFRGYIIEILSKEMVITSFTSVGNIFPFVVGGTGVVLATKGAYDIYKGNKSFKKICVVSGVALTLAGLYLYIGVKSNVPTESGKLIPFQENKFINLNDKI